MDRAAAGLAEDKIIIFATHIVFDVEDIADRVIILSQGQFCLNASMEDAMRQAEDIVWECVVKDAEEIKQIKKQYKVSRMQRQKDGVRMRIISDSKPCEGAVPVQGNLEETYLRLTENKSGNALKK